jgi:uncharacterized membrane protein required for colicin V production
MSLFRLQEALEEGSRPFISVDMATIDKVGLGLVALFLLLGIWRGLWWQVIRLLGVVAAVVAARTLTPRFTPQIESAIEQSPAVAYGVVWFSLFLCGLVLASLLGMIGKRALEAMQLGLVDRFGGALAGALTGVLLHSALLLLLSGFCTATWSASLLDGTYSEKLLVNVSNRWKLMVDAEAAEKIVGPVSEALGIQRGKAAEGGGPDGE